MDQRKRLAKVSPRIVLGWREWLALPDLGIGRIRAKIDTGARSSALHVDELAEFEVDATPWVRFTVATGAHDAEPVVVRAPVHDRRPVTDSGGHVSERIFLLTRLELAGRMYPIEINLASRRDMSFPMLLGRSALKGRFVVDPARSFRGRRASGSKAPSP
ncbi:MAG: ATP-dependent zinc protease [Proteobacteria bacterium]|nr:ATP-dependent zinc protease [Pseudomonadota bacterium]